MLKETAKTARSGLRTIDILARCGGEESIILLPETAMEGALVVAERLRRIVEEGPVAIEGQRPIRLTVSIGVCSSLINNSDMSALEGIINRADQLLYEAKRSGRNGGCSS